MLQGMLQDNHLFHSSFQHELFFVQVRSRHLNLIGLLHRHAEVAWKFEMLFTLK